MNKLQINLSSRPFTNRTPYHLGFVVIGLAGLLLLAHNAFWFFSNHGDVQLMEQEISALQDEVENNIREADAMAEEIDRVQRNRRFREVVAFVDGRIRQRRFSWIRMLNLLQDAIPADVKIESITPRVQQDSIRITLACMARKEAVVNEFIENLEEIDEFDRVLITSEDREGGTITFPLTMEYSPFGFENPSVSESEALESAGIGDRQAPEPGSLEEAISMAELPDPDSPGFGITAGEEGFDPFAVVEGDMFSEGEDLFSGMEGGAGEWALPPPSQEPDPDPDPEDKAATGSKKRKSSGALIKLPPRKPGDQLGRGSKSSGGGQS